MKTVTPGRRSPSPPPPSPKKQQKRPRWRRLDTVFTFPSSKRVHGLPYHSHYHAYSDPNNNSITSHSDSGSSHYKSKNAKAEGARSSSSASVWVRVSDKPQIASPDNIVRCEDLEKCPASPRKCNPHLIPHHQEDAVDGSSDEGYAVVDVSQRFIVADPPACAKGKEKLVESDQHKLCQRQKQIDYGKNTLGYERYLELVPRKQRKKYVHPQTPDIKQVCSKRSWDGQVKKWRRRLHEFDPPASENEEAPLLFSSDNGDDGQASHSPEEKDSTTASGSGGNSKEEDAGVSAIYDGWDGDDAMEP